MEFLKDVSLKEYNTWKVGGTADWAVFPTTPQEVQEACLWAKEKKVSITVIGGGSNILVSDEGIEGLTIITKNLAGITNEILENDCLTITCLAGTMKAEVLRSFVKNRLSPALFLAGLPGDMAGGVVMNAGVGHDLHPKEFCELVEWIEYVDLSVNTCDIKKLNKDKIEWSYRKSRGWQPGVITKLQIAWQEKPDPSILKRLQESNKRRMSTQPLQYPSCGSVFKNPQGTTSGRVIDECGLKGYHIGGAQVSEKHANFIINTGNATAKDIAQVISHVQTQVKYKKQIELQTECLFLGRW